MRIIFEAKLPSIIFRHSIRNPSLKINNYNLALMKTPKPIVVKSVTGAVTASILVSSCSPSYNFDDSYYGPHAENLTHGRSFFNLSESNLFGEFLYKLTAI